MFLIIIDCNCAAVGDNMLKQVVAIMKDSPQVPKDFEWCCRPVLKTLNIFGIPLRIRESDSNCFWIIYFIGWILYCLNVTSCLIITFLINETGEHQPTSVNQQIRSTAWQWNTGVDRYNTICSLIVTHTVLLAITTVRWKDLVRVLHRMEQCQQFTSQEFQEFRTTFQIGLSICILVSVDVPTKPLLQTLYYYKLIISIYIGLFGCYLLDVLCLDARFQMVANTNLCTSKVDGHFPVLGYHNILLFWLDCFNNA